MDRRIVNVGQIPLAEDWLQPQQDVMVAFGALFTALFGGERAVTGLEVTPTQPETMAVIVNAGAIYDFGPLEPTGFGVLPADATSIVKQGLMRNPVTLPVVAPPTVGYSRAYLVQAAFTEDDSDPVVLPYFNSQNPAVAFSGPGNNGQQQNTRRRGRVSVQLKAGAPSPTGTQVPPAADVGYVGLAIVTATNGSATISQGAIQSLQTVPRPPSNLLRLRPGFSEMVLFSSPGTVSWVVPAGVRRVRVRVWGGGGGGGGGANSYNGFAGSGGGAGAYSEGVMQVSPGQVIPITVGAGGAGGSTGGSGSGGGTSSFGSMMTATGGLGGQHQASNNTVQTAGGVATGGAINISGGVGGLVLQNNTSGHGGNSPSGGVGGTRSIGSASGPSGYGGGGGGAGGNGGALGASGAAGAVVLEF